MGKSVQLYNVLFNRIMKTLQMARVGFSWYMAQCCVSVKLAYAHSSLACTRRFVQIGLRNFSHMFVERLWGAIARGALQELARSTVGCQRLHGTFFGYFVCFF